MKQIYQTKNTALAVTLATCGVPFDVHPDTGVPIPFLNYYTREVLLAFTVRQPGNPQPVQRYKGWELEPAAADAWKRGLPGTIVYCFQRVDPIDEVLKSFDKHGESISRADDQSGGSGSQEVSVFPNVSPAAAAAICCQFAKNRRVMVEGWRTAIPWIVIPGDVETVHEGDKTYRVGSMKMYQLGASVESKRKIGL